MKGRKPTALEQKQLEGNPGKRPLPEPVIVGGRLRTIADLPECPEHIAILDDQAPALWRNIGEYLIDANVLAWGDLFMLESFIEAELIARQAGRELAELRRLGLKSFTTRGDRGTVRNPMFTVWRDARRTALQYAEHLGLTPVARARLGLAGLVGRKLERELGDGLPDNPVEHTDEGDGEIVDAEEV